MAEQRDLVWIQEAIVTYRRSREWFNKQIREGRLHKEGLPGDAKVYLRRDELETLMRDQRKE